MAERVYISIFIVKVVQKAATGNPEGGFCPKNRTKSVKPALIQVVYPKNRTKPPMHYVCSWASKVTLPKYLLSK